MTGEEGRLGKVRRNDGGRARDEMDWRGTEIGGKRGKGKGERKKEDGKGRQRRT